MTCLMPTLPELEMNKRVVNTTQELGNFPDSTTVRVSLIWAYTRSRARYSLVCLAKVTSSCTEFSARALGYHITCYMVAARDKCGNKISVKAAHRDRSGVTGAAASEYCAPPSRPW